MTDHHILAEALVDAADRQFIEAIKAYVVRFHKPMTRQEANELAATVGADILGVVKTAFDAWQNRQAERVHMGIN